jgi:hypothetical protein
MWCYVAAAQKIASTRAARRALGSAILLASAYLAGACAGPEAVSPARRARIEQSVVLNFAALGELVTTDGIRSIDEVIPLLARSFQSSYLLVYDSRSMQGASYHSPRVILHTNDARFIVAFNGDPDVRGYHALETMEFDDSERAFKLRTIQFPDPAGGSTGVVISEVNPPRCLRCHGTDPRPIWDAYPSWPGLYGDRDTWPWAAADSEGFAGFLAGRASSPRYAALIDAESVARRPPRRATAAYGGEDRPSRNASFGMKLQDLQYRAIARQVLAAPRFRPFAYALLGSLDAQCLDIERFVPGPVRATFGQPLADFQRLTDQANATATISKRSRMRGRDEPPLHARPETLTQFRYLVENGLKISTSLWTLAFEGGSYDFTSPRPSRLILEREIFEEIARTDLQMRTLYSRRASKDPYCSSLRKRSLEALAKEFSMKGQPSKPL